MGSAVDLGLTDMVVTRDGAVATIEIARFERRNSLNLGALEELCRALDWVAGSEDVAVTILRGSGGVFCAGYDLDLDSHLGLAGERFSTAADRARLDALRARLVRIRQSPKPIVAQIEGYCVAGGTDLLICSDVSVAAATARFAVPNVRALGISLLIPMWIEALGPARAKLLAMTGDEISGQTAAEWGLVSLAVPEDQVSHTAMAVAQRIATVPSDVMIPNKAALNLGSDLVGFENRSTTAMHLDVIAHGGPTARDFWAGVKERGLRETLRRRDRAFPGSLIEDVLRSDG